MAEVTLQIHVVLAKKTTFKSCVTKNMQYSNIYCVCILLLIKKLWYKILLLYDAL